MKRLFIKVLYVILGALFILIGLTAIYSGIYNYGTWSNWYFPNPNEFHGIFYNIEQADWYFGSNMLIIYGTLFVLIGLSLIVFPYNFFAQLIFVFLHLQQSSNPKELSRNKKTMKFFLLGTLALAVLLLYYVVFVM